MGIRNMEKLLSYEDDKLIIEGRNLIDIANMYKLSVPDFLELFKLYLNFTRKENGVKNCIINITEANIFTENISSSEKKISGEILVPTESYEDMKKILFDFAYTKCSEYGNRYRDCWGLNNVETWEPAFASQLTKDEEVYSCIYKVSNGWNQLISDLSINQIDKEKMYSLIKK